ncbi:MAG TPA: DUF6428 family protein [Trueperaceae bacterium]|nr:DUF6428 family protein [Trueperaceae bacterium]
MTTAEFIARLEPHANEPLIFSAAGARVPGGYHVTEFKSTSVNAMDCGGRAAAWQELVLQVLPPAAGEGEAPMSVGKFLSIYRRVANALPLPADALVRIEYGAAGERAVSYPVGAIARGAGGVIVELAAPTVACKANDHTVGNVPAVAAHAVLVGGSRAQALQATGCCAPAVSGSTSSACCA